MNAPITDVLRGHVEPWRVAVPVTVAPVDYGPTAVLSAEFYKGLKEVGASITSKSRLPILSCVHIYTWEGRLRLEATDLEHPSRVDVPARVNEEFNLCAPWRSLIDYVAISAHDGDCLELVWDPAVCILTVRGKGERYHAEFKGLDPAEFPPITEEQLQPRAAKPKTWAALCKSALKAGYTTITDLRGVTIPLLEAIHNAAYKPARYRWGSRPVNPVGDGDFWTLEVDQPETEEAEARPAFPCPAIVRHSPETEIVSLWKLGTEAVTITGEAPEIETDCGRGFWRRNPKLEEGEQADYYDTTDPQHPTYLGRMAGDPHKNAEDLDSWVDTFEGLRYVPDRESPHWLTARLQVWMHRKYHDPEEAE